MKNFLYKHITPPDMLERNNRREAKGLLSIRRPQLPVFAAQFPASRITRLFNHHDTRRQASGVADYRLGSGRLLTAVLQLYMEAQHRKYGCPHGSEVDIQDDQQRPISISNHSYTR